MVPNSQYSASRKMYFLSPPPKKNLWLHQFSHDTYSAMFRFLAMEYIRKAVLLFSEQKATCLLKKPDTAA